MNNSFHRSRVIDELAEKISPFFYIYDIKQQDGSIYFFITPKEAGAAVHGTEPHPLSMEPGTVYQKLWTIFAEKGYQFSFKRELGEDILVAAPFKHVHERIWINAVLALATFITTMVMGSFMFGADPISNPSEALKGIPFTIAIMGVLGAHEAGHYLVAKKHGMHTSLPYFIPFPSLIGTMGAVIRHRGPIPNRTALFDVGVSGPLIGLSVSIIVTAIGLLQPPVQQIQDGYAIQLTLPPLFELIARLIPAGEPAGEMVAIHPIAFAGWVGMLVTALNLIPAGQLDGGHVLRAMMGEKASYISTIVPFVLITLGFYVNYSQKGDGFLWVFWGLFLSLFAASGHPRPLNDEVPLGKGRLVLGIITFILGLLSITPAPFQMQ
jgi:membrane-associated protease RseP (regulator of RpoE activity)